MEIPSELYKIAKLDERAKAISIKPENPPIGIQQPNSNQSTYISSNITKPKMPDTRYSVQSSTPFQGIIGTSTLSDAIRGEKKLDIPDYLHNSDIKKQTTPVRSMPHKIINSSAELQKILSPKQKGT